MSDVKNLCYKIFERMDILIQNKLGNMVLVRLYKTIILPYFHWGIKTTSDKEIKANLLFIYLTLKPFFEKKQLKDQMDFAKKLGDTSLDKLHNKELEEAKRYF
jgi:hypothetical protein